MPKKRTNPPPADGELPKYNLRSRRQQDANAADAEIVRWVEEDDSDYEPSDEEAPEAPPTVITIVVGGGTAKKRSKETQEELEDELADLLADQAASAASAESAAPKLQPLEKAYYKSLSKQKQKEYNKKLDALSKLTTADDVPYKFRVLDLPLSDAAKAGLLRKVDLLNEMGLENGEAYKLRNWLDTFFRIPFGKTIPLPVSVASGRDACVEFLRNASTTMDEAIYGMKPAKLQIQQILAQWISNPEASGNVIALQGPMGVGKTSFARNAIANVLQRPFLFFSLGGASDIANFVGHSYTYEGSTWGQIVDAILRAGCMNPVFYFDELDKVSTTPHGEEIISMLIHLTDRSQNMHYHDRYFAGIDFDLSQCLFVFSFNDESKVHPILKDRMNVIHCGGYSEEDKKVILSKYIWASVLDHIKVNPDMVSLQEDAIAYLVREYSKGEEGVRNLIRAVEAIVTRANLLYISQKTDYPFYVPITFPMKISREAAEKLLTGLAPKEIGSWINMYT